MHKSFFSLFAGRKKTDGIAKMLLLFCKQTIMLLRGGFCTAGICDVLKEKNFCIEIKISVKLFAFLSASAILKCVQAVVWLPAVLI